MSETPDLRGLLIRALDALNYATLELVYASEAIDPRDGGQLLLEAGQRAGAVGSEIVRVIGPYKDPTATEEVRADATWRVERRECWQRIARNRKARAKRRAK